MSQLDRFLSSKSRDRHSEYQYSDEDDDQQDADVEVKQVVARRSTIIHVQQSETDGSDQEEELFSCVVWRKVLPVLGRMFKKAQLRVVDGQVGIFKDDYAQTALKMFDQPHLELLKEKDGRYGFTLNGEYYATENLSDRAEIVRLTGVSKGSPSPVKHTPISPHSVRPSVINSNVYDGLEAQKDQVSVKRKSVMTMDYSPSEVVQSKEVLDDIELPTLDLPHIDAPKLNFQYPSFEQSRQSAYQEIDVDQVPYQAVSLQPRSQLQPTEPVQSLEPEEEPIEEPQVEPAGPSVSAIELKAVNQKLDDMKDQDMMFSSAIEQVNVKLEELAKSQPVVDMAGLQKEISKIDTKVDLTAVSSSLTKIIEYLSRSVEIQNTADLQFHKKLDSIVQATSKSKPDSRILNIEKDLLNVTRTLSAQQMNDDVPIKAIRKEIGQLLVVVNEIKQQSSGDALTKVDQVNQQLSQYLVSSRNESVNMVQLAQNVTQVVDQIKQLQGEVITMKRDLLTPSPQKELRGSSPTRSLYGNDTVSVVAHLMDLTKSVSVLRNQVSDLAIHSNQQQVNVKRMLAESKPSDDLTEVKSLLKELLQKQDTGKQDNQKFKDIMTELEHLQYGFQNQMTAFRKTLQSAIPVDSQEVDNLRKQVEELQLENSKLQIRKK